MTRISKSLKSPGGRPAGKPAVGANARLVAGKKTPVAATGSGSATFAGKPASGKSPMKSPSTFRSPTRTASSRRGSYRLAMSQGSGKPTAASGDVIPGYELPLANAPAAAPVPDYGGNLAQTAAGPVGLSPTKPNPNPNSPSQQGQRGTS